MNSARLDAYVPACAECATGKKPYTVRLTGYSLVEPAAEPERFWDHAGKYHQHTFSYDGATFACSNGHTWHENIYDECPVPGCTWTKDAADVRVKSLEKLAKERMKAEKVEKKATP